MKGGTMKTAVTAVFFLFCVVALAFSAQVFRVDTAGAVKQALASAGPGDTILVKPGEYDMGATFSTGKSGTPDKPVTFRCEGDKGYAKFKVNGQIGFRIRSRYWVIQGIHVEGSTKSTQAVVFMDGPGGCGDVKILDCKFSASSQHGMKAARTSEKAVDNVLLAHVEIYDTGATAFDLVSGDNWVLRNCYVHDYGKAGGVTYGIFLKGGGKNGIIEGCFVDGGKRATTVGISFGGGLTGKQWLPKAGDNVAPEHEGGIARNNIVVNTADVAYHSNNGSRCFFYNNLAWGCKGFQRQASYPPDPVLVNNLIAGSYAGASKDSRNNLNKIEKTWFVNADEYDFRLTAEGSAVLDGKGEELADNPVDYFGTKRKSGPQCLGPVLPDATQSTRWTDRRK